MPISYRIEKNEGLLYLTVHGPIDPQQIIANSDKMLADPDYAPGMNMFVDAREMDISGANSGDLELIAADSLSKRELFAPSRCAVVVASDAAFGIVRMYEVYSEDHPLTVRAFRNENEAREWLST